MSRSRVLYVDGAVNLLLGIGLLTFPQWLVESLGIPDAASSFYPAILGAVLFGMGIALCVEASTEGGGAVGLGLVGAIAINLCGAAVVAGWLAVGQLALPTRGQVFLWLLVVVLVAISAEEWQLHGRVRHRAST